MRRRAEPRPAARPREERRHDRHPVRLPACQGGRRADRRRVGGRGRCAGRARRGAGDLLESVSLFDVYTGDQVGEGRKSLAFALRFRADRTLTDAEAAEARQKAVAVAVERFGAVQRA
nr:hypothetical protein [Tessaracoccus coleopterorum]